MDRKKHIFWGIGAGFAAIVLVLLWQLDPLHWQKLDTNRLSNIRQTTLVFDRNGDVTGSLYGAENRVTVPLEQIPKHVQDAFIAAEDARFYQHSGVDVYRIFGALWQDIKSMSFKQGASTITQQLIKLTHLTSEKSLSRKVQEAVLAMQLERRMSKDEILENYLNIVYFGKSAYGIEAAANAYFGKSAQDLTLAEGALLAGVIKSPSSYAPNLNPDRALARRDQILNSMSENGLVSPTKAEQAQNEPLQLVSERADASTASWYLDATLQEAQQILSLSTEEVLSGGYRIYTAFDAQLQQAAEALYADAGSFPPNAADGTPVQSAMAVLNPQNGELLALMGGRSYDVKRGLNRATQIARQPGSALKPLSVYAAAVDAYGYVPSSLVDDTQREFDGGYAPRNAADSYNGIVTLREALSRSLNAATVGLAESVGVERMRGYVERFGIALDADDANLSLALGSMTYGVSPAQLCAAYGALANGGMRVKGHLILRIESCGGEEIYRFQSVSERCISAESAYLITDMLKTAAQSGSARALGQLSFPVAAKTGTVSMQGGGNRDAWTVAYTPEIAVCVWMGFDNPDSSHALDGSNGGGSYPARLAAAFLGQAAGQLSGRDFSTPAGIRRAAIDRLALEQTNQVLLAGENTPADYVESELFLKNSIPKSVSDMWNMPRRVTDLRLESRDGEIPVLAFTSQDANTDYILLRIGDEGTEIAAILQGEAGSVLRFADMEARLEDAWSYKILPRHRLLYEKGILLTGEESTAVSYRPSGILNRIVEIWDAPATQPPAETTSEADQSIFG